VKGFILNLPEKVKLLLRCDAICITEQNHKSNEYIELCYLHFSLIMSYSSTCQQERQRIFIRRTVNNNR